MRKEVVSSPLFDLSAQDAVAWLKNQPAGSVDLVITDPAYESLEKHRAVGTTTRLKHSKSSSNDWFRVFPNERFGELFTQRFMDIDVSLPLNDALDLAWQTMAECFEPQELLMRDQMIERYYPKHVQPASA